MKRSLFTSSQSFSTLETTKMQALFPFEKKYGLGSKKGSVDWMWKGALSAVGIVSALGSAQAADWTGSLNNQFTNDANWSAPLGNTSAPNSSVGYIHSTVNFPLIDGETVFMDKIVLGDYEQYAGALAIQNNSIVHVNHFKIGNGLLGTPSAGIFDPEPTSKLFVSGGSQLVLGNGVVEWGSNGYAQVSFDDAKLDARNATNFSVGTTMNADADVTFSGSTSSAIFGHPVQIGVEGSGVVLFSAGARGEFASKLVLANQSTAVGILRVLGGAQVSVREVSMSDSAGARSQLIVDGESAVTVLNDLVIGNRGTGSIDVTDSSLQVGGSVAVANNTGSNGNIFLKDSADLTIDGALRVANAYNAGALVFVQGGSTLRVKGTEGISVGNDDNNASSTVSVQDSQIIAKQMNLGTVMSASVTLDVDNRSILELDQMIVGDIGNATFNLMRDSSIRVNAGDLILSKQNGSIVTGVISNSNINVRAGDLIIAQKRGIVNLDIFGDSSRVSVNGDVLFGAGDSFTNLSDNAVLEAKTIDIGGIDAGVLAYHEVNLRNGAILRASEQINLGGGGGSASLAVGNGPASAGFIETPKIVFGPRYSNLQMLFTNPSWTLGAELSSLDTSGGDISGRIYQYLQPNRTTYFTANSTNYKGITHIARGILSLGNGGATGNLSGSITVDTEGTLAFERNNQLIFDATVAGDGTILQKGTGTTTLVADNSSFIGKGIVAAGTLKAGADPHALGASSAQYEIQQGGTLAIEQSNVQLDSVQNAGNLVIAANKVLTVNDYQQSATGWLEVAAGTSGASIVSNGSLDLSGGLKLTGFSNVLNTAPVKASEVSNAVYLVAQTTGSPITGRFTESNITPLNTLTLPNYLIKGAVVLDSSQTKVLVKELGLAWTDGTAENASGLFNMTGGTQFNVDIALADRTAPFATGWNGQTLTKTGNGSLLLSADNTYTGGTEINEGSVSVASANNLGTGTVYLGDANSNTAATLVFEASPSGVGISNTGLNAGTTATILNTIAFGQRLDNTIQVTQQADRVTLAGELTSAPSTRAVNSNTGFVKTGLGTLVIDPAVGNSVVFDGDIKVQQGTLAFVGDGSQMTMNGNLGLTTPNAALQFDITSNQMHMNGTITGVAGGSAIEKSSLGTLLLAGASNTSWNVTGGVLAVSNSLFNNDVTLSAGTSLSFVHDALQAPVLEAFYTGTLNGASTSILELDRTASLLNLQYNENSRIGDILVTSGTMKLAQVDSQPDPTTNTVNRFQITGDLTVKNTGTAYLAGGNTYLGVDGSVYLESGSTLKLALDADRPLIADIFANGVTLSSGTALEMAGFAVPVRFNPNLDADLRKVFKASQLPGFSYLVMDSINDISGTFDTPAPGTPLNTPGYLLSDVLYQTDSNGNALNSSAISEMSLGNFRLAWFDQTLNLAGDVQYANGTFDMDEGTALNLDVALTNQSAGTGVFQTGWDGESLLKKGKGLLILSDADNAYTGTTTINGGMLLTLEDQVLTNSRQVVVGKEGTLALHSSMQRLKQLDNQGTITLGENGQLFLQNLDDSNQVVDSYLGGVVSGGNALHDGVTTSTIVVENGTVHLGSAQGVVSPSKVEVDRLLLQPNTSLEIHAEGTLITQIPGDTSAAHRVQVHEGGTWVVTRDSAVDTLALSAGGKVSFGDPSQHYGVAGRTLTVQTWEGSTNADLPNHLVLYGKKENSTTVQNDQLVIGGAVTGETKIQYIDLGGSADVLRNGNEILLVKNAGTSTIDEAAFTGTFTSGTNTYRVKALAEGFGFQGPAYRTPLIQHYDALLGGMTRGNTAMVATVGSLEPLTRMHHCDLQQAFGQISGGRGDTNQYTNAGETSYKQVSTLVGSSLYGTSSANDCLTAGVFVGYADLDHNYQLFDREQGKHQIKQQQLGSYIRYHQDDGFYAIGSMVYGNYDASLTDVDDPVKRDIDARSLAFSVEAGQKFDVMDGLYLMPSVQLIHQRTQIDGVRTAIAQTEFDHVNGTFARVGVKLGDQSADQTRWGVMANVWHQSDTKTQIHTYSLADGKRLGDPFINEDRTTWGELKLTVETQANEQMSIFAEAGYSGSFDSSNQGATGQLGVKYRW